MEDESFDMDRSFFPGPPREFFWSMEVKPGKRYSELLQEDLHITHVCLGDDASSNSLSVLYCEPEEDLCHPICRLREGKIEQLSLDLFFPAGGDLTLYTSEGSASLHLLGYFQEGEDGDDEEDDDSEDEDEDLEDEEDEEEEVQIERKRKADVAPVQEQPKKKAKKKLEVAASAPNLGKVNLKEAQPKKTEKKAVEKKAVEKKAVEKKAVEKKAVEKKVEKKAEKKDEIGVSKKLSLGVVSTVTQAGRGTVIAKNGKKVKVQYRGTLQKGGKQFDAGKIDFRLGVGDVIKGWDIGVNGMKLGEKRTLVIPPAAGYGKRGAPPDIPGNATLKFEVTLLNIQ